MSNVILHEQIKQTLKQNIRSIVLKTGVQNEITATELSCFNLFFLKFLVDYINNEFNKEISNTPQKPFSQKANTSDSIQQMNLPKQGLGSIVGYQNTNPKIDDIVNQTIVQQLILFKKLFRFDIKRRVILLNKVSEFNNDFQTVDDQELLSIDTKVSFPLETRPLHEEFQLRNFVVDGDRFVICNNKVNNITRIHKDIIIPLYEYYSKDSVINILVVKGITSNQLTNKDDMQFKQMFIQGNAVELSIDGVSGNQVLYDLENNLIPNIKYGIFIKEHSTQIDQFVITNPIFFNNTVCERIVIDNRDKFSPIHRIVI